MSKEFQTPGWLDSQMFTLKMCSTFVSIQSNRANSTFGNFSLQHVLGCANDSTLMLIYVSNSLLSYLLYHFVASDLKELLVRRCIV